MSQNPTISALDTAQAVKRTYDEANDAIRTIPAASTSFTVELDATDGDSVQAWLYDGAGSPVVKGQATMANSLPVVLASNQSAIPVTQSGTWTQITTASSSSTKVSLTNASTGVVLPAMSSVGMKSYNLYTKTTSTITGPQTLTLEVSPHDTDDVWSATSLTIIPSVTNDVVIMGVVNSAIVGRRVRVSIAAAITTGTFDLYLVMQGS